MHYDVRILNRRTDDITPGAIYVGRPTVWGNPFTVAEFGRGLAVIEYADWLMTNTSARWIRSNILRLAGRDLVCWCAPERCHAMVLAAAAHAKANGGLAVDGILSLLDDWAHS